jgi:hypothetical protein
VRLQVTEIVVGESAKFTGAQQAQMLGEAWERIEKSEEVRARLVAYKRSGDLDTFHLGPHTPPLTEEDLDLIHRLWLESVQRFGLAVHHRDVVRAALERLEHDMSGEGREEAISHIGAQARGTAVTTAAPPGPDDT